MYYDPERLIEDYVPADSMWDLSPMRARRLVSTTKLPRPLTKSQPSTKELWQLSNLQYPSMNRTLDCACMLLRPQSVVPLAPPI
jgi:hypothetical protein